MGAPKVKRSTNKAKTAHRYKAAHQRANKPEQKCNATTTRGTKQESITANCDGCLGTNVPFDYLEEVVPNALK